MAFECKYKKEASFLMEADKRHLEALFRTKKDYIEIMGTLYALRAETLKRCEEENIDMPTKPIVWKILRVTNRLLKALGSNHKNIIFYENGTYRELERKR